VKLGASRHLRRIKLLHRSLNSFSCDVSAYVVIVDFGAELAAEDGIDVEEAVVSCFVVRTSFGEGVIGVDVTIPSQSKNHCAKL
jgi:hypothetical protein